MPIYEYQCRRCGKQFEELVMSVCQKVLCPSCGSDELEKLISAPARSCKSCNGCSSCSPT